MQSNACMTPSRHSSCVRRTAREPCLRNARSLVSLCNPNTRSLAQPRLQASPFTWALNVAEEVKRGAFLAGTSMGTPVLGLRAVRAARSARSNDPKLRRV